MTMQTILTNFMSAYQQQHAISPEQYKVIRHLGQCRTPALGGQFLACNECDFTQYRYHSCRNRHCPKCQQRATQEWSDRQMENLLPVNYYHVVFTLPHELNAWVQLHPAVLYRCLFQSVWHTIKTFGADRRRLNGEMGMSSILHTWGQNLYRHVHLHCLIPGGALSVSQTEEQWHEAKSNYLFPVKALSRHFRGTMISALRQSYRAGDLGKLTSGGVDEVLNKLMKKEWVVYSKAYLKRPETVLRYLGRYTRKIAFSEGRLRTITDEKVVMDYKDYRDSKTKPLQLTGVEFLRRFLLHVLPSGFMRIRHYGFLANRVRREKLTCIRSCLMQPNSNSNETVSTTDTAKEKQTETPPCPCPKCKSGRLLVRYDILPVRRIDERQRTH